MAPPPGMPGGVPPRGPAAPPPGMPGPGQPPLGGPPNQGTMRPPAAPMGPPPGMGPGGPGPGGPGPASMPAGPGVPPRLPGPDIPPRSTARAGLEQGMGAFRGARTELRRRMREQQRLRMLTLIAVVVVVLGALPLYLLIQAANRDPVFASLDALNVPSWAAAASQDQVAGSRWCVIECRFRERDISSDKAPDETNTVYVKALETAGWTRWKPAAGCPQGEVTGHYSCWRRDEYTLDLWVRNKPCSDDLLRNRPTAAPGASAPALPAGKDECGGSMVSFKVNNAIADERLTQPDQAPPSPAVP
jgi:hypothetical protein